MIKPLTCVAVLWMTCGMADAQADETTFGDWTLSINSSTAEQPQPELGDWTIKITPREASEEQPIVPPAPVAKPQTIRVQVKVAGQPCRHPSSWYGFHLPRVRSGSSIYFPWKNYRRFVGFTSQYRPRTIYNYGR